MFSRASSSAPDAPVTTVSISYHAKLLLARASAEQSVVDQLQAQLDAFGTGGSAAALRRSDTSDALSVGMDLFEIISGAGDDSIRVQASNATIDSGAGNDVIDVDGQANVVAGEGDDVVFTYGHSTVDGGAGNDHIDAYDNAVVDAGTGDDTVRTYSHATVSAGDGDDHVWTHDYSVVDAGAGNDMIWVGGSSTVTGGAGDDYISVTGDNSTINFAKGDGNDVVRVDNGSDSVDFSISGYSLNDVIVTQQLGSTTVISRAPTIPLFSMDRHD